MNEDVNKALQALLAVYPEPFDYTKIDYARWREYRADGQEISESEVFQNEIKHLTNTVLRDTVTYAATVEQVVSARAYILALEDLAQRLAHIPDPDEVKPSDSPTEAL